MVPVIRIGNICIIFLFKIDCATVITKYEFNHEWEVIPGICVIPCPIGPHFGIMFFTTTIIGFSFSPVGICYFFTRDPLPVAFFFFIRETDPDIESIKTVNRIPYEIILTRGSDSS